jgi:electron transfer flavoprotein beta subunit
MKVVVCIKQVPDTAEVKINPETGTLIREGIPSIINPFDMHAIEAGLQMKEKIGGTVTVLTMGPPQAETALKEAIAMGADEGVLLSDRAFAGSDTWATSFALSKAIEQLGADIVICGKQAIDGDTAQVGPETAEFLNIPHISYVKKIESISESSLTVQRMMDDGYDIVESAFPVLITVVKDLNNPRLPSLKGKMAAKKAVIKKMGQAEIMADENDLGLKGSPTQVKNIFTPEARSERHMLEGTIEEQVDQLLKELRGLKCL